MCRSLFFNNVAGLRSAALLKKSPTQVSSCQFYEVFESTFFTEYFRMTADE